MKNIALILAAGSSNRCGFDKLLHEYQGTCALEKCVTTFKKSANIEDIWIICSDEKYNDLKNRFPQATGFILGGETRFESVANAIEHCEIYYPENVRIIVHNGANPHLKLEDLDEGIKRAETQKNIIFGYFTPNSLKHVVGGKVEVYLDRSKTFETQTPQISDLDTFSHALEIHQDRSCDFSETQSSTTTNTSKTGLEPRDEAELLSHIDEEVFIYECDPSNTKITFAHDFENPNLKIGVGEDHHTFADQFDPQKPFRLGGIDLSEGQISSDGNSDGDLIFHALCNALLSAHGDRTFDPIAQPLCQAGDTKSESYLTATIDHLDFDRSRIEQVLISLVGQKPKIAPKHTEIVANIAQILEIKSTQIGLTYTTGEGMVEGMSAQVLVILKS